jgi:hypothetical protein
MDTSIDCTGEIKGIYWALFNNLNSWCPQWCPNLIKMDSEAAALKHQKRHFQSYYIWL